LFLPAVDLFLPRSNAKSMIPSFLLQSPVLQQVSDLNSSFNYFPIAVQLIFAVVVVAGLIALSHFLGPRRNTSDKLETFESGIEKQGNARRPMAIKYFLVAILFVLFDVEVIFFYPYAVNFRQLGWEGFSAVLLFVGFFLAGFIYIIKKGALNWEE
jgi:NADH-quinone oxidoreductase subunit A